MKWQDIATAPRDGTPVLLWDGSDRIVGEYRVRGDGTAFWEIGHRDNGVLIALGAVATHWMPLPDPPTTESAA